MFLIRGTDDRVNLPKLMAIVGFVLLLAFVGGGVWVLFESPPPSLGKGTVAAALCLIGVILMAITHCIAFFLGMIAGARNVPEALNVWGAITKVLSDGIALIARAAKPAVQTTRRRRKRR